MSKKLSGILTIVAAIIGFGAFYFFVRIVMEGDDPIVESADLQASIVSPFISFASFVLIATMAITILFSLWNLIKNPHVLKTSLIGIGIMAVLLVVSYVLASDGAVTDGIGNILPEGEAGSVSKWVSTLINYSFILGAIGLVFVLLDFVKGLIK